MSNFGTSSCPAARRHRRDRAGLTQLPRSIGDFAASAAQCWPALDAWWARDADDLGVMEFWAYVADIVAFYGEVAAHEAYIRTARQPAP